jgi:hypothetical protein
VQASVCCSMDTFVDSSLSLNLTLDDSKQFEMVNYSMIFHVLHSLHVEKR